MSASEATSSERNFTYRHTRIIVLCFVLLVFGACGTYALSFNRRPERLPFAIAGLAVVLAVLIRLLLHLGETLTITSAGIRRDSLFGTVEQPWASVVEIKRGRSFLEADSLKIVAETGQSMTIGGDDLIDFEGFCKLVAQRSMAARAESNWIKVD